MGSECVLGWIECHPGTASWVQAVGAIISILAAIWVSGSERRHRSKIEKAANKDALGRALGAATHAKKIADNNLEFFSCSHLPRSEMPRFLLVVDAAATRVISVSEGPGIDSEISGHLYEINNALIDIRGLIEQCVSSLDPTPTLQIDYLTDNVNRIAKAIEGLEAIRR